MVLTFPRNAWMIRGWFRGDPYVRMETWVVLVLASKSWIKKGKSLRVVWIRYLGVGTSPKWILVAIQVLVLVFSLVLSRDGIFWNPTRTLVWSWNRISRVGGPACVNRGAFVVNKILAVTSRGLPWAARLKFTIRQDESSLEPLRFFLSDGKKSFGCVTPLTCFSCLDGDVVNPPRL